VSYVAGGAGNEHTQRANVVAFDELGLVPRMLVPGAERDLSIELLGLSRPSPLMLAPIGVIGLCAQDGHGDLATARAAAATSVPMIASTLSVDPLEDVAAAFGDTPGFFQLYTPNDCELAESFVSRAEAAGFAGVVVTLDTWVPGWRPRDLTLGSFPQLRGHCLANYFSYPVFRARLEKASRGGRPHRRAALGAPVRQPDPQLGRPGVAAVVDEAADPAQGDLPSRGRAAGDRRRRRPDLLLEPRWSPGQRRHPGDPPPAGDRRRRRRDPRGLRFRRARRRAQEAPGSTFPAPLARHSLSSASGVRSAIVG
jgi:hypothetical protein